MNRRIFRGLSMQWQSSYLLLIVVTLILLGGVEAYGWRFRYARGAIYFLLFGLGAMLWTFLVGLIAISPPELARVLVLVKYFVIAFEPVPVLLFVLAYAGRERCLQYPYIVGLCVIPSLTQGVVWTNSYHHLMLRVLEIDSNHGFSHISEISFGPWYWVHALYGYLLILSSAGVVGLSMVRGGSLARRQSIPILVGVLAPLLANVLLITRIAPLEIDPMPFGLAVTAVLFVWGGYRYRLLDLVPVARGALVEAINEGMLVVDGEGRIIDMNPAMSTMLDVAPRKLMGTPVDSALGERPEIQSLLDLDPGPGGEDLEAEIQIGGRDFEVRVVLFGGGAENRGRLLVMREQTERKQMERERERLISELREALTQVKTLKGMLPLCANCKKVRDDEGYWHQVDVYIRDHSDAEITHGICPDCHELLYPEYSKPE